MRGSARQAGRLIGFCGRCARVAATAALVVAVLLSAPACRRPAPESALVYALASEDEAIAANAVRELDGLPAAEQERVVRRLARELGKIPFGLTNAPTALRRIAPVALPVLLALRADPAQRAQVDTALQNMGPAAGAAVPALERSLAEDDRQYRVWAATALASIAPDRVPPAIARAADADPGVALSLGMALRYAPGAESAVPGLALLLRDPRPRVREFSAAALAELGGRAVPARSDLLAVASDPDERTRRQVARALALVGRAAPADADAPGGGAS